MERFKGSKTQKCTKPIQLTVECYTAADQGYNDDNKRALKNKQPQEGTCPVCMEGCDGFDPSQAKELYLPSHRAVSAKVWLDYQLAWVIMKKWNVVLSSMDK